MNAFELEREQRIATNKRKMEVNFPAKLSRRESCFTTNGVCTVKFTYNFPAIRVRRAERRDVSAVERHLSLDTKSI